MSELTISISEEKPARLRERTSAYGVGAEELVRAGIDRLLEVLKRISRRQRRTCSRRTKNCTQGRPDAFLVVAQSDLTS
ncbi:MAG: hypothetical protein V1792_06915 [Pseudomonadota bacterium]